MPAGEQLNREKKNNTEISRNQEIEVYFNRIHRDLMTAADHKHLHSLERMFDAVGFLTEDEYQWLRGKKHAYDAASLRMKFDNRAEATDLKLNTVFNRIGG